MKAQSRIAERPELARPLARWLAHLLEHSRDTSRHEIPRAGELDAGQLIALASELGFAVSVVLVKSLTRTDAAVAISFWMLVVQSAIGLVPALLVWR